VLRQCWHARTASLLRFPSFLAADPMPLLVPRQVPGNIRRAEHFVAFLRRFVAYMKQRLDVQQVEADTPESFLAHLQSQVAIDGEHSHYIMT